jgi:hypothetical protein
MSIISSPTQAKQTTQIEIVSGATLAELQANTNNFLADLNEDLTKNYFVSVGLTVEISAGFTLTLVYSYLTITTTEL